MHHEIKVVFNSYGTIIRCDVTRTLQSSCAKVLKIRLTSNVPLEVESREAMVDIYAHTQKWNGKKSVYQPVRISGEHQAGESFSSTNLSCL